MEETVPIIEGFAEAKSWDLFGGGVKLVIIVSTDRVPEHRPYPLQLHDASQGAGADDPIL